MKMFGAWGLAFLAIASAASTSTAASLLTRDALWSVVRTCESARASLGISFPCLEIRSSTDGYSVALLRPPLPKTHLLVIPLAKVAGIESPELRGGAGAAYLSMAWSARDKAGGELGPIPWDSTGIAINSAANRSQDQLHIHVGCLSPQAKASLAKTGMSLGESWRVLWTGVWARRLRGDDLRAADPLGPSLERLLGPIGLAGLNFGVAGFERSGRRRGFVLPASKSMSFERLLDPNCARLHAEHRS